MEIKDLKLSQTAPTLKASAQPGSSLSLGITASDYNYLIHFTSDKVVQFSDNSSDMEARQSCTVRASHPSRALRPEDVELHTFQVRRPQLQP